MKKVIRYTGTFVGFMLALFGIIACMCETCDIGQQLGTFGIGIVLNVVGVAIAVLASWEEEDVFA